MSVVEAESSERVHALEALVARMQRELTATSDRLAGVTTERDNLRRAYRQLMEQFELLRRRIFIAKAERVDATQLELEFASTKQKLDELAAKLGAEAESGAAGDGVGARPAGKPPVRAKTKPKGRRNLADVDHLPERRIEIRDAGRGVPLARAPVQYGLLGIYANVAERLCLVDRQTLNLTPSFGRQLAEAFLSENRHALAPAQGNGPRR